ncbi:YtxH domain-containing protein [Paenibacillus sp. NPDC056579]|uniref:YtxH domain-containing protein n=1 Tax=unclassified Paenibacillus TaxID=185978 RepID=UPI001EF8FC81|nr:YtxH domain-containing protein [Paenibacillus sp. H1-7]ULL14572.1 YtxH domain-containing protein [Paenibacillus sp. H1-7]
MAEKKGKDLLVGAVVGTVLGAVTALLLAPKSGRELRSDLAEGVQTISEKTQHVAENVIDKSKQLAGTISEKTQIIGSQTTEWAGKVKEKALAWKQGKADEAAEVPVAATIVEQDHQQSEPSDK